MSMIKGSCKAKNAASKKKREADHDSRRTSPQKWSSDNFFYEVDIGMTLNTNLYVEHD